MSRRVAKGSKKATLIPDSNYRICEYLYRTDGGQRWRLDKMPFFAPIYDIPRNKILLLTSRQSTKTTYLRNTSVTRSLRNRGNATLYVAPTNTQVTDFSRKKLDNIFAYTPELKNLFVGRDCTWNVTLKEFNVDGGRSVITLRSTGGAQGAGRIRGNTANDLLLDEFQDLLAEDLPVIEECAATFDGQDGRPTAFYAYTGTPLTNQNHIQRQFNISRQYQWHMQCPHCSSGTGVSHTANQDIYRREIRTGGWNDPVGMQHVDPDRPYLLCQHCGADMNCPPGMPEGTRVPPFGKWIAHNPKGRFDGFRVVRMMMPWARWRTENNDGVLDRLELWPERRFMNEVMGLSFDSGTQPITEKDVRAICDNYDLPHSDAEALQVAAQHRGYLKFAGLDWAMQATGDDTASYTIIGVFALVNDKLKLIYAHRFVGLGSNDPEYVMKKIEWVMDTFEVKRLGADYGVGYKEDLRLMTKYGMDRVAAFQYKATVGKSESTYDEGALKWIVPKTRTMDQFCTDIKNGQFILPRYEEAKYYTDDWLNLSVDYNPATRTIRYEKLGPEDFAHVGNYANLAKRMEFREGDFAGRQAAGLGPLVQADSLYDDGYFDEPGIAITH